jgi:hypothetical protein
MPDVAPVCAIVGDDPFLQPRAVADAGIQDGPDAQRIDFHSYASTPADALYELQSLSMFGLFKLAIMRDARGVGKPTHPPGSFAPERLRRHATGSEGRSPPSDNALQCRCLTFKNIR